MSVAGTGALLTKPFLPPSEHLFLNADVGTGAG